MKVSWTTKKLGCEWAHAMIFLQMYPWTEQEWRKTAVTAVPLMVLVLSCREPDQCIVLTFANNVSIIAIIIMIFFYFYYFFFSRLLFLLPHYLFRCLSFVLSFPPVFLVARASHTHTLHLYYFNRGVLTKTTQHFQASGGDNGRLQSDETVSIRFERNNAN